MFFFKFYIVQCTVNKILLDKGNVLKIYQSNKINSNNITRISSNGVTINHTINLTENIYYVF